jgi:hypothetical protein
MAKIKNVYDKVSYDRLREDVKDIIVYISKEKVNDIEDSIHYRTAPKGGVVPSISVTIETKIDTQVATIISCCKILKSLLDKEGLSPFVTLGIDEISNKLNEIQTFFSDKNINLITDRMIPLSFGKGTVIDTLAASKEKQINFRISMQEKILKLIPLIDELKSLKETMQVKGGYEKPHRMTLKRNKNE